MRQLTDQPDIIKEAITRDTASVELGRFFGILLEIERRIDAEDGNLSASEQV